MVRHPIQTIEVEKAPNWDEDHMREAEVEIQQMDGWDDEAADFLKANLEAAQKKQQKFRPKPWDLPQMVRPSNTKPYDPIRLYARMMRYYQGLTPVVIDEMHYKTFFGLAREAVVQTEEEQEELDRKYGKGKNSSQPSILDYRNIGQPTVPWEGPVHRLG